MEHARRQTAIETLKMTGFNFTRADIPRVMRKWAEDKDWDLADFASLAKRHVLGPLFQTLFLHGTSPQHSADNGVIDFIGSTLSDHAPATNLDDYYGSPRQNSQIDSALYSTGLVQHVADGAATSFAGTTAPPVEILRTPIAVVGYGPAGIMLVSALRKTGFNNITVFDKSGKRSLGIWGQTNVYGRSRNNPRNINYLDYQLTSAPGPGAEVKEFLDNLVTKYDPHLVKRVKVVQIQPGNLEHAIYYEVKDGEGPAVVAKDTYPIVINCVGLGDPAPLNDPLRMTTDADSTKESGPRWQQTLDRAAIQDKRFLFIGLGNSTAEMVRQIRSHMDLIGPSLNADYQILTHYPQDAVFNPNDVVNFKDRDYRVFRDLTKPNLVNYQGDLPEFRSDYYRSVAEGRIISDVKHWRRVNDSIVCTTKKNQKSPISFSKIFTLTGYKHSVDTMKAMGCTYDEENKCARYDYDGEMIRFDGSRTNRLFRGYFGLGAVLDAPHNPNSIVIPGMVFRIPDLMFSITMRAAEVVRRADLALARKES